MIAHNTTLNNTAAPIPASNPDTRESGGLSDASLFGQPPELPWMNPGYPGLVNEMHLWQWWLTASDSAIELRGITPGRAPAILTYPYEDLRYACVQALSRDQEYAGVYRVMNSIAPSLARESRAANAGDVLRRDWLLVDVDPVRPADCSATEAEKWQAWAVTHQIRDALTRYGWPPPVIADSGNGYHLLYRVHLPAHDPERLIQRCLRALDHQHSRGEARVDTAVHDPARLTKFYGATSRKGESTPHRPHRRSGIITMPDGLHRDIVSLDHLRALAAMAAVPVIDPVAASETATTEVVPVDPSPEVLGAALAHAAAAEPAIEGQSGSKVCFRLCCELVQGYLLPDAIAMQVLRDSGWNASCQGPWSDAELAHKIADARRAKGVRRPGYLLAGCGSKSTAARVQIAAGPDLHRVAGDVTNALADSAPLADVAKLRDATTPATTPATASTRQRITPGTLVRALDRNNFGSVVCDDGGSITVHFQSPQGDTADVEIPPSQLLFADGSPADPAAQPVLTPVPIADLVRQNPTLRPAVIDGLLRRGEVANIIAKSKVGKSWLSYTVALSVATGGRLFDRFRCSRGRVLLIDNELHPEVLSHRIPIVADAWGVSLASLTDRLDVLPLRGRSTNIYGLHSTFAAIRNKTYDLVILDAMYRALPAGVNENDNAAIAQIYNTLDAYAAMTGAAFLIVHHASKGDQNGKDVTDVGSGAGSQSRAADTHLILRPHTEDGVVVAEAAVRSWRPVDPFCLRWEYPVWHLADDCDPSALRLPATRQNERQTAKDREGHDAIVSALREHGELTQRKLREVADLSYDRGNRLLAAMVRDGRLITSETRVRGNPSTTYTLAEYIRNA